MCSGGLAKRAKAFAPSLCAIYDTGSNPGYMLCFFLQFLENFQTLRANYPFGRSWAIERPILIKSPHFRPNLSLGPIHVHPRVLCEN